MTREKKPFLFDQKWDDGEVRHYYDDSEIVADFDVSELLAAHDAGYAARKRAGGRGKKWASEIDDLVQRVLDTDISLRDILSDHELKSVYTRGKTKVNDAFEVRYLAQMLEEVEKLRAEVFEKTFFFFDGLTDQGKTYLLDGLCQKLTELTGWQSYQPASKNASDDYAGQQIIRFNEVGSRALEWPDWLTLTGPREAGPLSARYKNKADVAPRVVIAAISMGPIEYSFFIPGKRSASDSLDQYLRRIAVHVSAAKIDGEPRYTLRRMGVVDRYIHSVRVPGRYSPEHVGLTYGAVEVIEGLDRDQAVEVLVAEVAKRSPDVFGEIEPSPLWPAIEAADLGEPVLTENELKIAELQDQLAAAQAAAAAQQITA